MESEIKGRIVRECSTCSFGAQDVDQEPCNTCFEEKAYYNQWVFDPDYMTNLVIENVPSDRVGYSIQILQYMYEFYKLANPDKHDYSSFNLSEYLKSISIHLPDMSLNKRLQPKSYQFDCRPLNQNMDEIKIELNRFKKYVLQSVIKLKRNSNKSIPFAEIRSSSGKDITLIALNVMKNALLVANARKNSIPNNEIINLLKRKKPVETAEQEKMAIDDIYRHRDNANVLVERILKGTFPNDEHGEWRLK